MGTRLLEFEEVRPVINQSVVPVEWSLHPKTGVVFPAICCLRLYPLNKVRYTLSIAL